jgi:hypothetical protein
LRKVFGHERREVQEVVENCVVRSCIISFPRCVYYLGDVINSSSISWAECVTRKRECKMHSEFWWKNLKERDDLVDLGY